MIPRMIVVTGTRRAGTSMWMQILEAAGFDCIGEAFPSDWRETIGEANPGGFYESMLRHGVYYRTNPNPETGEYVHPEQVAKHVVKIFIPGLVRSDLSYLQRVLATVRPWRDYARSVQRMQAMEQEARGHDAPIPQLPPAMEWWESNFKLVGDLAMRGYPCHVQAYEEVLARPRETIGAVLEWIGLGGDVDAAAARVLEAGKAKATSHAVQDADDDEALAGGIAPEHLRVFDQFYGAVRDGEGLSSGLIAEMNRVYEALMPALHDAKVTVMRDMEAWLAHHVAEGPFVPFE